MKTVCGVLILFAGVSFGQVASGPAPAGATGQCKDGSYSTAAKKWQACAGHKGVQSWFADAKTGAGATPASTPKQSSAAKSTPTAANGSAAPAPRAVTAAPGGGPGLVWVNTSTNIYHCPGGTFYGKTKEGKYMPEADAKKSGAHGDRGKVCSK